jgi:hypothetical protein
LEEEGSYASPVPSVEGKIEGDRRAAQGDGSSEKAVGPAQAGGEATGEGSTSLARTPFTQLSVRFWIRTSLFALPPPVVMTLSFY